MDDALYKDAVEAKRHAAAIDRIAASTQVRPEEVGPLYERMLAKMQRKARITTYLAIFTRKKGRGAAPKAERSAPQTLLRRALHDKRSMTERRMGKERLYSSP